MRGAAPSPTRSLYPFRRSEIAWLMISFAIGPIPGNCDSAPLAIAIPGLIFGFKSSKMQLLS